ncbi:hypothetical protein APA_3739 [Pseudanabaena sp. lw0831]|nr:hypothetical protein APA_3739 [Pseudanabaena sp. lw0831]
MQQQAVLQIDSTICEETMYKYVPSFKKRQNLRSSYNVGVLK